ncbi:MAG: class I SAM-dependent methyltransferase [Pseudomonadota bacterium]
MIDSRLHCPGCPAGAATALQPAKGGGHYCPGCDEHYPTFKVGNAALHWCYPHPQHSQQRWLFETRRTLDELARQQRELKHRNGCGGLTALNRIRLARAMRGTQVQRDTLTELLAPLGLTGSLPESPVVGSMRLPQLQSYRANPFRDWGWDTPETEQMCDAVLEVLRAATNELPQRLLTLGAGAGRLSYDLHHALGLTRSTLLDLNPKLLGIAGRVISGQPLTLAEFPVAPVNLESACVVRELKLAERQPALHEEMDFVLGDALEAPFADGSCEAVLTPWLIDIVPTPLPRLLGSINRLLPIGGLWLNTGSLAFGHGDALADDLSFEEVATLIEQSGFRLLEVRRRTLPYLQSPASAHRRSELVTTFCAVKKRAPPEQLGMSEEPGAAAAQHRAPDAVVSRAPRQEALAAHHLLRAQVLAAVDGNRTAEQLAVLLSNRYQLDPVNALSTVNEILREADL